MEPFPIGAVPDRLSAPYTVMKQPADSRPESMRDGSVTAPIPHGCASDRPAPQWDTMTRSAGAMRAALPGTIMHDVPYHVATCECAMERVAPQQNA